MTTKTQKKSSNNEIDTKPNLESKEDTNQTEIHIKPKTPKKDKGRFWLFLKVLFHWRTLRLLLSHHPFCERFENHTYNLGKIRFCRGCLLSYPLVYALPLIYLLWGAANDFFTSTALWFQNIWWFVIGFGILAIGGRLIGKYSIVIKDLSKFGRGAWSGTFIIVIFSQHWGFKIGAFVLLFGGLTFLSLNRGKDMERTCQECEWQANYDICPGWKDVSEHLAQLNLKPETKPKIDTTSTAQETTNE